jgi:hypothetical protein
MPGSAAVSVVVMRFGVAVVILIIIASLRLITDGEQ